MKPISLSTSTLPAPASLPSSHTLPLIPTNTASDHPLVTHTGCQGSSPHILTLRHPGKCSPFPSPGVHCLSMSPHVSYIPTESTQDAQQVGFNNGVKPAEIHREPTHIQMNINSSKENEGIADETVGNGWEERHTHASWKVQI